MRIQPDSTINLYSGVEIDNGEQLVFSTRNNQNAYFQNKLVAQQVNCTVVRKTGALKIEIGQYGVAKALLPTCNYISFINPAFDNKTVYARIVDYDYVNNECAEISYVIDYWQTWMFDVSFDECYIDREHLSQSDFAAAAQNPYNPNILEFRTNEDLPVTKDMEKPYYTIGGQNSDGGFLGERVCESTGIPDEIGALVVFSDVNFSNLDTGATPGNEPSLKFKNVLKSMTFPGGSQADTLSTFKLTSEAKTYLTTKYSDFSSCFNDSANSNISKGAQWDTKSPFGSNRINAPVNYAYFFRAANAGGLLGWFTDVDCLDSVLGVYPVPTGLMYLSGISQGNPQAFTIETASGQSVVNKKLDLFPYSYYRIVTPNGDVKELKIEDFRAAQLSNADCVLCGTMDIVEKPNLIVGPTNYKYGGIAPNNSDVNMNPMESLFFTQFPTLPYDIDGFKSQMAAVANSIIGNNTIMYQNELQYQSEILNDKTISGALGGAIGAGSAGASVISGDLSGAVGSGLSAAQQMRMAQLNEQYKRPELENQASMLIDAYNVIAGGDQGALKANYKYARPAYAADIYNPINGDGVVNANVNMFYDILVMRVSLHPSILARYDRYFTDYGYNSGRCGIPRVVNYMRGGADPTTLPSWLDINGKDTTYVKTRDCKVVYSMLPVAQFIKAMFDGGVRFIKGDNLQ